MPFNIYRKIIRNNKEDIEKIFGKAMDEISFVPLNLLPAFVYSMTK